jgi:peptidoglycan/LPS O-acetylase OafA/YrhL
MRTRALPEFLIGICVGHWLRARRADNIVLSRGRAVTLEALALLALAGTWIALGARPDSKPWLDSGVSAPVLSLLVVALAIGSGPLARLLSTRPLQILGHASYALYLLQEPILIWILHIPLVGLLPKPAFLALFVAVLIGASTACQRFVGEPARAWLLGRPGRAHPESAVTITRLS